MNLYDAYMTPRDRAAASDVEVLAVPAPTVGRAPTVAPPPTPSPACGCGGTEYPSLAMVYAPKQCFRMLYEPDRALLRGTLFAELDKPLEGGRR